MTIQFKEVNRDNFIECIKLKVSEEQKHFVATNVFSLAQAKVNPEWTPLCVYNNDQMVGFVMFGMDVDDESVWIMRLMIDERYQKHGFGKEALLKVIDLIKQKYDVKEVKLSIEPDNTVAQKLYEQVGFVNTGIIIEEEVVFIKEI